MYNCCTRSEGQIYQGRGKNKKAISFFGLGDAINFARDYSIKYQTVCEVFNCRENIFNKDTDKKVAAYKKGGVIYFNIDK